MVIHTIHDNGVLGLTIGLNGDRPKAAGGYTVNITTIRLQLGGVKSDNLLCDVSVRYPPRKSGCAVHIQIGCLASTGRKHH